MGEGEMLLFNLCEWKRKERDGLGKQYNIFAFKMAFVDPPKTAFTDQRIRVEVLCCSGQLLECENLRSNIPFSGLCC